MSAFGFSIADFVPCEVCGNRAVDIHHIENRKMGGDPQGNKDVIDNLQALCRNCHLEYGDVPELKEKLKQIHIAYMKNNGVNQNL
jgi:5-methylcytosine-specific restriction endonuclease McrA